MATQTATEARGYVLGVDEIPPPEFTPEYSAYLLETLREWLSTVDLEVADHGAQD
jgi:hypothetical protein